MYVIGGLVDIVEDGVIGFLFYGVNVDGLCCCVEWVMCIFCLLGLL